MFYKAQITLLGDLLESKNSTFGGKSSASQILFILGRITPFIRKSSGYWNFNDQDMKIIRMSNVPFFYG